MQQPMWRLPTLRRTETADARTGLDHPNPALGGLANSPTASDDGSRRSAAEGGARVMKAHFAIAAVAVGMVLGLGVIVVATLGTASDIRANSQEPRFNATAHCQDGTWSWSKDPEAPEACAHHGGVDAALR